MIKDLNRDRLNLKQELEKSEKLCHKLRKFEEESKELKKIKDSTSTLKVIKHIDHFLLLNHKHCRQRFGSIL